MTREFSPREEFLNQRTDIVRSLLRVAGTGVSTTGILLTPKVQKVVKEVALKSSQELRQEWDEVNQADS